MKKTYTCLQFIFIILIIFSYTKTYGQSDFDKDQHDIYSYFFSGENDKAKTIIDQKFIGSNDNTKQIIGYFFLGWYYEKIQNDSLQLVCVNEAKKLAQISQDSLSQVYVNFGYARLNKKNRNTPFYTEALTTTIKTLENYPNNNFLWSLIYSKRAQILGVYNVNENDMLFLKKANEYAKKANVPELIFYSKRALSSFYINSFTNISKSKANLDSALYYITSMKEDIGKIKNPIGQERAFLDYNVNMACYTICSPEEKYTLAIEYLDKALINIDKYKGYLQKYAAFVYVNKGVCYTKQRNMEKAEENFSLALKNVNNVEFAEMDKQMILKCLVNINSYKGNYEKAYEYLSEAFDFYTNEKNEDFDNDLRIVEVIMDNKLQKQQYLQLEEETKLYKKQNTLYLAISIILIILISLLVYLRKINKKVNLQKTELLELEKKRIINETEILKLQNEKIQKEAIAMSLRFDQKQNVLKSVYDSVKNKEIPKVQKILKEDQNTDINLDILQHINKNIHPSFMKNLNQAAKQKLTILDQRYAACIFLDMDNQQIAETFNVELNTVRVTKFRLKSKLGLSKDDDLKEFIQKLST